MGRLLQLSGSDCTAVPDVTRFGRNYWFACLYATAVATLLFWPQPNFKVPFFFPFFQIGCFISSSAHRLLTDARSREDSNAIRGNLIALRLSSVALFAVVIRIALAWLLSL